MAVVDYFLKIDGVPGESLDDKHKGEIEIESFSWGLSRTGPLPAAGGGSAGKASFQDFHFSTPVNRSSPNLFLKCATGQHLKQAVLTARKAGGGQGGEEFLKLTFSDVLVSSYHDGAHGARGSAAVIAPPADTVGGPIGGAGAAGQAPTDNASLRYARAQVSSGKASVGIPPSGSWVLRFDPATNTFAKVDAPGGLFTVGSAGGVVSRAVLEFDVATLIGLLTNPFGMARLGLAITEIREAAVPAAGAASLGVQRRADTIDAIDAKPPRFDVILYAPADGVPTVDDLTRHGKRIGRLTVDPTAPPTSLEVDLTELVRHRHLTSFGIRIQLRGARLPDLTGDKHDHKGRDDNEDKHDNKGKNDEDDDNNEDDDDDKDDDNDRRDGPSPQRANTRGDHEDDHQDRHGKHDDDRKRTPSPDVSASFTVDLVLETA